MRSVVVVLPASLCAMMPMLRVFSSEYCRSTSSPALSSTGEGGGPPAAPLLVGSPLPAVVSERLVGLRHLVRVLALLHGGAAVVGRVEQLRRQLLRHRTLGPAPRGTDDPPHRERRPTARPDLARHLVRRPADPG